MNKRKINLSTATSTGYRPVEHIGRPHLVRATLSMPTPASHYRNELEGRVHLISSPPAAVCDGAQMGLAIAKEMFEQKEKLERRLHRDLTAREADNFVLQKPLRKAMESVNPSYYLGLSPEAGAKSGAWWPFDGWLGNADTLSPMTPPYVAAVMLNLLRLEAASRTVLVGAGSGYTSHLALRTMGPDGSLFSFEVDKSREKYLYDAMENAGAWKLPATANSTVYFMDYGRMVELGIGVDRLVFFAALPYLPEMAVEHLDEGKDGVIVYPQYRPCPDGENYQDNLARLMVFTRRRNDDGKMVEHLYKTEFFRPFVRLTPEMPP